MVRVSLLAVALAFSGAALASPSTSEQAVNQEGLQDALDAASVELLKPGAKRQGWDKGGLDLAKMLEAMPGGTARHYLISNDGDGKRTLTIFGAKDLATAPANWSVLDPVGTEKMAAPMMLVISHFDGPYYFAAWQQERRVGDAFCAAGRVGGQLYERPGATAASELPRQMVPVMIKAMAQILEKQPYCWRFDRSGDGITTRYFTEDGRSMPGLDKLDEVMTIVPAGAVEALLDGKAPGQK